jgi:hypothetical protein
MSGQDYLSEVRAFLLEQGLGKCRRAILTKQLEKHGGETVKAVTDSTTHILVGNNTRLSRIPVLLKADSIPDTVSVLRADWLSACLTKGHLVPEESYQVCDPATPNPSTPAAQPPSKTQVTKQGEPSGLQKREQKEGKIAAVTDSNVSMSSPKPGMFAVSTRRWTKSPKKGKEDQRNWDSSDSDYVESDEDQEEQEDEETSVRAEEVSAYLSIAFIENLCAID